MSMRIEKDSLGSIEVPKSAYWGAQTQRSLENFQIGYQDQFPSEFIHAYALVKKAAAQVNGSLGLLSQQKAQAIALAASQVQSGKLDKHFPLVVWQTGSGTQTNMNLNEVISRKANEILTEQGVKEEIHPNDDVNKGQSSNDTFPTAMHLAVALQVKGYLVPRLQQGILVLKDKIKEFEGLVKIGRTHLMDATPLTLAQEFSSYLAQWEQALTGVNQNLKTLYALPIGGTAVGTGLNTHPEFSNKVCEILKKETGLDFHSSLNKFSGIAAHDAFVQVSGTLNTLATFFMKMANDLRLLGSGPRSGLAELKLPVNEPGSSIMPGKVNPTQCEALAMVCAQVMGNHVAVTVGCASGHLQLNTFKPLIVWNLLTSTRILADASESFTKKCLSGLKANKEQINVHLERSLMLVTALNVHIGYDKAATIAKKAYAENITLKQAAMNLNFLTEKQFDEWVQPDQMVSPK